MAFGENILDFEVEFSNIREERAAMEKELEKSQTWLDKLKKNSMVVNTRLEKAHIKETARYQDKKDKERATKRKQLMNEAQKHVDEYSKAWYAAHKKNQKLDEDIAKQKKKNLDKAIADERKRLTFIHDMKVRTLKREIADREKEEKEHTAFLKKEAAKRKADYDKSFMGSVTGGTTFGHKFATTSQYAAAGAAIYGVAEAFRTVVEASVQYDNALLNIMAVLQTSRLQAEALLNTNRDLAVEYGYIVSELDSASIVLGRAGVAMGELAAATKVTAQLARITGDSLEDSSKVVSSFTMAFGLASEEVEDLGNKLAYAANASKLSIEDLGTMANYALSGAKALGLTKEEVLALSTAFSNVGVNASTIGTQIRKFGKLVRDDAKSSIKFFQDMGISQDKLMNDLKGNDPKAFTEFVRQVKDMNSETYNNSVQGMEILTKQFLDTIRTTGDNVLEHYDRIEKGGDSLAAQSKIQALSIESLWNSAVAAIGRSASGIATDVVDAFTNRDELIAYTEALKHVERGTADYEKIRKKLIVLSGGKFDFGAEEAKTAEEKYGELATGMWETSDEIKKLQDKFNKAMKSNSVNVAGTLGVISSQLSEAKARMKSLREEAEKLNKVGGKGERGELELSYSPKLALQIQQTQAKINGLEQTALQVKKDALALLNIEIEKLDEIESATERKQSEGELELRRLRIELEYKKSITAEEKKAASQREKDLNQRAENQWNNDYDSWIDSPDDKGSELEARQLAHMAKMIELQHTLNEIKYEGEILSLEHTEASMEYLSEWVDSIDNMSDGVQNFTKGLFDVSAIMASNAKDEKKFSKQRESIDKKFSKDVSKIWKDIGKLQNATQKDFDNATEESKKLYVNSTEEQKNLTEEQQRAEIDGYLAIASTITGAVKGAVDEGSEAAKALAVIDSIGAIIKAWNSAPTPYNIPAVAATTAATASLLGQMGASSVATTALPTKPKELGVVGGYESGSLFNVTITDDMKDFSAAVEKATDALESMGNLGSATNIELESSALVLADSLRQAFSSVFTMFSFFGGTEEQVADAANVNITDSQLIAKHGSSLNSRYQSQLEWDESLLYEDYRDNIGNFVDIYSDYTSKQLDIMSDNLNFEDLSQSDLNSIVDSLNIDRESAKETTADLLDASIEFKRTGIMSAELAERISTAFNDTNYRNFIDYADAIELFDERLKNSADNIKSWEDSFKTEKELTQDMLNEINEIEKTEYTLADTVEEINNLFDSLKGGIGGLTDVELEFLQANKELIDSVETSVSDIFNAWSGSLSYLTLQQKSLLADGYYELSQVEGSSINAVDAALAKAEAAYKTAKTREEYIPAFDNYINELKNEAPENTLDDVVGRLDTLIDRVEELEETERMKSA